ncbi:RNA-directed DNA polymerase [Persicimonas caeni]|uniref:RNA-directed DNA polymerase n=1 Tax=Persicimonas caeni TaxID=2292766 RepID=A0A4Y6PPD5_PERCE|nr:RNA-directed DNA polymerase [Persicimonas caeni]QDG50206.1 RNA-directed DNA polymerase [Persicimonas caeni]QED31427.1 RNA-directed DNA polymerase [Persicimonas caeni]
MSRRAPTLDSLLRSGYFPKELPPAFTTAPFANAFAEKDIDEEFFGITNASDPNAVANRFKGASATRPAQHFLALRNGGRRRLEVPNPASFYWLAKEISAGWHELWAKIGRSQLSISAPQVNDDSSRAVTPQSPGNKRPEIRAQRFCYGTILFECDIASYYPSIYTHSIPWVLHGKEKAKSNKNGLKLLGNRLDKLCQNCQRRQTRGIPVGPDTSLIISELLLSEVDVRLSELDELRGGMRFYDDFELVCETDDDANLLRSSIEDALEWLELEVNNRKCRIERLPVELDPPWRRELRRWEAKKRSGPSIRGVNKLNPQELLDFWDTTTALQGDAPHDPVIKEAIVRLSLRDGLAVRPSRRYQKFLASALRLQPALARPAFTELLRIKKHGCLDADLLNDVLSHRVKRFAQTRATNEVAWSVWGALALDVSLGEECGQILADVDDAFVALLSLIAREKGLITGLGRIERWKSWCTAESLKDENWLGCYQIAKSGLIDGVDNSILESQHYSSQLRAADVDFVDIDDFDDIDALIAKLNLKRLARELDGGGQS